MNVTVENLAPCKKLVRVEIDAAKVDEAFAATTKEYQREASLPGFRRGKAPLDRVAKLYDKEIQDEVKRKLFNQGYSDAVKEQKLDVITYPDIEEIQFGRGQALQFAATVETAPQFELPEYRGLPARRETGVVSDADIDRALKLLCDRQATYTKVERAVQDNDFVVINYTGTCEGKPLTDLAPTARSLTEQKGFWVHVQKEGFIPGFAEQLVGAKAGDRRTVTVDFPADFVTAQLAGKKGVYEVEIVEVKERTLPPIDDQFAVSYGAENLEKLRAGVRSDLQNEFNQKQRRSVRGQVAEALLNRVVCDLPESAVNAETKSVVYDIVGENQKRGVSKEILDQQKDQIYGLANQTAKERVKASFIFNRIAEKEGIKVGQEEVNLRIIALAQNYQMAPDKFAKELEKRNGITQIYEQMLNEKVLDFLQENAKIEDVAATPAPTPA